MTKQAMKQKRTKNKKMKKIKKPKKKLISKKKIICGLRTSWIFFCNEHRKNLRREFPDLPFGDLCKKLAPKWKQLTADQRQIYIDMQNKDQQRYKQEYKSLSKEQLQMLRKHKKIARAKKKLLPKPVLSSYMFFVVKNRNKIQQDFPNISFQEIGKKLGTIWNQLSLTEKQPYINMNIEDKKRYDQELQFCQKNTVH